MSKRIVDLNIWTPFDTIGKAAEFRERIASENKEFNLIWENSETTFNSSFIFYADSEDLKNWEKMLFLSSEGTLEERRKKVYLKWNKQVIWTDRTLRKYMDEWLGIANYDYELKYNEYSFLLKLNISKMLKINEKDIYYRLRKIIPANLELDLLLMFNEQIIYTDKTKTYENRLYTVGNTYKTGTIFKHQYVGKKYNSNINYKNNSGLKKQRIFHAKEIKTGGVKR